MTERGSGGTENAGGGGAGAAAGAAPTVGASSPNALSAMRATMERLRAQGVDISHIAHLPMGVYTGLSRGYAPEEIVALYKDYIATNGGDAYTAFVSSHDQGDSVNAFLAGRRNAPWAPSDPRLRVPPRGTPGAMGAFDYQAAYRAYNEAQGRYPAPAATPADPAAGGGASGGASAGAAPPGASPPVTTTRGDPSPGGAPAPPTPPPSGGPAPTVGGPTQTTRDGGAGSAGGAGGIGGGAVGGAGGGSYGGDWLAGLIRELLSRGGGSSYGPSYGPPYGAPRPRPPWMGGGRSTPWWTRGTYGDDYGDPYGDDSWDGFSVDEGDDGYDGYDDYGAPSHVAGGYGPYAPRGVPRVPGYVYSPRRYQQAMSPRGGGYGSYRQAPYPGARGVRADLFDPRRDWDSAHSISPPGTGRVPGAGGFSGTTAFHPARGGVMPGVIRPEERGGIAVRPGYGSFRRPVMKPRMPGAGGAAGTEIAPPTRPEPLQTKPWAPFDASKAPPMPGLRGSGLDRKRPFPGMESPGNPSDEEGLLA